MYVAEADIRRASAVGGLSKSVSKGSRDHTNGVRARAILALRQDLRAAGVRRLTQGEPCTEHEALDDQRHRRLPTPTRTLVRVRSILAMRQDLRASRVRRLAQGEPCTEAGSSRDPENPSGTAGLPTPKRAPAASGCKIESPIDEHCETSLRVHLPGYGSRFIVQASPSSVSQTSSLTCPSSTANVTRWVP